MKKCRYYCLVVVLLSAACAPKGESANKEATTMKQPETTPKTTPLAPESEQSVTRVIRQVPLLEKEKVSALLRTWRQVPNRGAYRAVKPSDFNIPQWVEKEFYWSDVVHATGWASDYGEMSGAYGLIVFIVDKNITDVNRFSVVAFIERPGTQYSLHWILRDKDLSRVNLRRHSGDVYLQEFREDGTSHICDVQWDRKQARWDCNLD